MRELQRRRQATNVFAGKHGFITPRDLFKWAERGAVGYQVRLIDNLSSSLSICQFEAGNELEVICWFALPAHTGIRPLGFCNTMLLSP